ncbi:MAG: hypothetical protein C4293_14545, partial [Nitrospiraceae bacterium]
LALLALLLICGSLMVLPGRIVAANWFPGALALGDTAMTTAMIYLSGNGTSDLYLTYFVIILIVTMPRTPRQMFLWLSVVCLIYGMLLYQEFRQSGVILEHHLLRIPLLLVMALFYSRTAESARKLAAYDSLTGLPNRHQFLRIATQALAAARRDKRNLALLLLNLDGFKLINDTLGHATGDQLLKGVATRLTECVQRSGTIARHGADEFAVLLEEMLSSEHASYLAKMILSTMAAPFLLDGREIFVTARIGVALYPQDADTAATLIKNAGAALSHAKEQGQNRYQFYSADMNTRAQKRLTLENALRKAIEQEDLQVYYQPQIDLTTGRIVGLEVLARRQQSELGSVPPAQFIPVAEDTGLIVPIGEWVMRKACLQIKAWHKEGWSTMQLSVNLSPRQFKQPNLVKMVEQVLLETGLPSRFLELEITESVIMQQAEATIGTLRDLKSLGIHLSIDDFGTGYSSLSYLTRFPIDTLKIDQAFVKDLATNSDAEAIVTAVIATAHALKLQVIAEGVEHTDQATFLSDRGCHKAQGFLFSQPLPAGKMAEFIRAWPHHHRHLAIPAFQSYKES